MATRSYPLKRVFRKSLALPSEHGAWIWLLGPLAIGLAAGGSWDPAMLWLVLGALAVFLLRHPAAIAVRALSGRRSKGDLWPALLWVAFYAAIALVTALWLAQQGHERLLLLAVPGLPVFAWHLWLISRRQERGRMDIEVVGAGVLALAAPAAYWVSGGARSSSAWILWALVWLQSVASIVHVYLRLDWCRKPNPPAGRERWKAARRALLYHGFNLAFAVGLATLGQVHWLVPLAFLSMQLDLAETLLRPPAGLKPTRIGLRQLGSSLLFVFMSALGFSLSRP